MSCCGTRYRVKKLVIKQQLSQVTQLPKSQVREDDIIQLPKEQRKLFRCPFSINEHIKPDYLIVATMDYSNLGDKKLVEVMGQMMRQENMEKSQSLSIREQDIYITNVQGNVIDRHRQDKINEGQRQLTVIDQLKEKRSREEQSRRQHPREQMMMMN